MSQSVLAPTAAQAAKLEAEFEAELDAELTDDELEAVVGGLRIPLPHILTVTAA